MQGRSAVAPEAQPMLVLDEPVTGIILAGGRSTRMLQEKAWVELNGRPLVRWVLDALRMATDEQIIVARHVGRFETLGVPVVIDKVATRSPLAGLHAGLKAVPTDLNVVVACDLPLVRPEMVALLARAVGPTHAAVPYVGVGAPPPPGQFTTAREAGLQPLCAAYRRSCLGPLEKLLSVGHIATAAIVSVVKARIVGPDEWRTVDPDGRSFFNVNTPEDVIAAAHILSRAD